MPFKDIINNDFIIEETDKWDESKDIHFHNCYELYYLLEGEITYLVNEKMYTVTQSDIVLIPPFSLHKTAPLKNPKHKRILIYFTNDFFKDFLSYNPKFLNCFNYTLFSTPQKHIIENILKILLNEFKNDNDLIYIKSKMGELITLINRFIATFQFCKVPFKENEKASEIIKYLNEEYSNTITLDILSKKFFLNRFYLSRMFKEFTGIGYIEYLNKLRIKKSISLLANTTLNITEIAFKVGFNSSNHYCKIFKSIIGISPLKYRNSNIETYKFQ